MYTRDNISLELAEAESISEMLRPALKSDETLGGTWLYIDFRCDFSPIFFFKMHYLV